MAILLVIGIVHLEYLVLSSNQLFACGISSDLVKFIDSTADLFKHLVWKS